MKFQGVIPILTTPFNKNESIDLNSLEKLINFMMKIKVNGITILGVLGEANRITYKERELIIKKTISCSKDLPVIVGASASGTSIVKDLCIMADDLGASAVMITPSNELNNDSNKIIELYYQSAKATRLPIVLQDHPASSGVVMSTSLILNLINEIPTIKCIKAESVPTAAKIFSLKKNKKKKIKILTGLGALYAFFDLKQKSDGFNTGFAFPEVLQAMVKHRNRNNWQKVFDIYQTYLPLMVYEQQPSIGIRKEFLKKRGLISENIVRHPGKNIIQIEKKSIEDLLKNIFKGKDILKKITI